MVNGFAQGVNLLPDGVHHLSEQQITFACFSSNSRAMFLSLYDSTLISYLSSFFRSFNKMSSNDSSFLSYSFFTYSFIASSLLSLSLSGLWVSFRGLWVSLSVLSRLRGLWVYSATIRRQILKNSAPLMLHLQTGTCRSGSS